MLSTSSSSTIGKLEGCILIHGADDAPACRLGLRTESTVAFVFSGSDDEFRDNTGCNIIGDADALCLYSIVANGGAAATVDGPCLITDTLGVAPSIDGGVPLVVVVVVLLLSSVTEAAGSLVGEQSTS